MDKESFVEACSKSGYCTKTVARQYVKQILRIRIMILIL